ncbi:MAG: ABC-type uncharacterized transport system involved in gliding motility auxiliary subunit [Planctomycetota bacterium]|jgi:ABC-type uncharacterized transport system involved in gliding motility auxiliary subunit
MNKKMLSSAGLLLAVVLFVAGNLLASRALKKARVDMTQEQLFTLSEGARNIAAKVSEPVQMYLYFSEDAVADVDPGLLDFGRRVRDQLEEFARISGGNIQLEVIDPEPFSEEEDEAVAEGLERASLPDGSPFFLGIVGADILDRREVIPFINPNDPTAERYLEYNVARMLYQLSSPDRQTVGVLSTIPMQGVPGNPMRGQAGVPGWRILGELGRFFDVALLPPNTQVINESIDVLMIIHPRNLPPETQYAIDQFVLAGGPALFFVDPHCENDRSEVDPENPIMGMFADKSSDLNNLFGAWGFEVVGSQVVADRENCARVRNPSQEPGDLPSIEFPPILVLDENAVASGDAAVSSLKSLVFRYAGSIEAMPGATTTLDALVQTGTDSMLIDAGMLQGNPDPKEILNGFVAADKRRLTVVGRVTGTATSAFPTGLGEGEEADTEHLTEGSIHVVVVSDADMLADVDWIRERRLGSLSLGWQKTTDNGDLAINALEGLAGGEDLGRLQVRAKSPRPFETFEEMQAEAEQTYLDEQSALETELATVQERINGLQSEKSADQRMILSPEQEAALDEAREKQKETRRKLRDVRLSLSKDIESLKMRIKVANIAGVPLLVLLVGIGVAFSRNRNRG